MNLLLVATLALFGQAAPSAQCQLPELEPASSTHCAHIARSRARDRLLDTAKQLSPDAVGPVVPVSKEDVERCAGVLRGEGTFALEADHGAESAFAMGLDSPGMAAMRQALARGRTTEGPSTIAFNSVTFLGCGAHFPVLVDLQRPVSGFLVDRQRRWLVAVHVGQRRYSGASVPYYLSETFLSLVDLHTLEVQQVPLDSLGLSFQSVAVAFDEKQQLLVRLKDSWNGYQDRRLYARCALGARCAFQLTLAPGEFPTSGVLEVTASGAYRLDRWPERFKAPPGLVHRSVRPSPDGKRVAYVTGDEPAETTVRRTLWIAAADGSRPRKVATGLGLLHALWVDGDRLRYDADPASNPKLKAERERLMRSPEVQEMLRGDGDDPEEKELHRQVVEGMVMQALAQQIAEGLVEGVTLRDLQEERVMEYRLSTGRASPWTSSRHLRLYSDHQQPNIRGGDVIDVNPD